jgi:potassium efflux system protein
MQAKQDSVALHALNEIGGNLDRSPTSTANTALTRQAPRTLSDKTNRVVVTVGVAYGSDVSHAMALMLEAAQENENVLDDPKPVASFESFGDNALTLLLRSYLGSMDNRLATITALHQAINDKFHVAGINIAFPQRDIHLSTERPLDIRLHKATTQPIKP